MELGVLVEKLDAKCPDAIDKSTSDDEIEINIDAIDPRTFHDLDRYVRQCLDQSHPKNKNQARAGGAQPRRATQVPRELGREAAREGGAARRLRFSRGGISLRPRRLPLPRRPPRQQRNILVSA